MVIIMAAFNAIPYDFFGRQEVLTIYFFIGRMNPPHGGHEAALRQLMEKAMAESSIPLILVGSGPNKGERTLDNPLTFENKQRVLNYRLSGSLCEIRQMSEPVRNVMEWTHEVIRNTVRPAKVVFKLVTGDKDDNSTKLDWIHKSLKKGMDALGIESESVSIPIKAMKMSGVEMSATRIRQDALSCFLSGDTSFHSKYSGFYGPHTENVFGEIVEIAQVLTPEELHHYAATGEMAKKSKSKAKSQNKGQNKGPSKGKTKKNS